MGDVEQGGRVEHVQRTGDRAEHGLTRGAPDDPADGYGGEQVPAQRDEFDRLAQPQAVLCSSRVEARVLQPAIGGADRLVGVQRHGWIDRVRFGPLPAIGRLDTAQGDQTCPVHVVGDVASDRPVRIADHVAGRIAQQMADQQRHEAGAGEDSQGSDHGLRATTTLCAARMFTPGVTSTAFSTQPQTPDIAAGRKSGVNPLRNTRCGASPASRMSCTSSARGTSRSSPESCGTRFIRIGQYGLAGLWSHNTTKPPGLTTRAISRTVVATRSGVSRWCSVATVSARSNELGAKGRAVVIPAKVPARPRSRARATIDADRSTPKTS